MGQELIFKKVRFRDLDIPEFIKIRLVGIFKDLVFLISLPSHSCNNKNGTGPSDEWKSCPEIIERAIILNEDGKIAYQVVMRGCKKHGISGGVRLSRRDLKTIIGNMEGEGKEKILELIKNMEDEPEVQRPRPKKNLRPEHDLSFVNRGEEDKEEEIEEEVRNTRRDTLDAMNFRPDRERPASDKIVGLKDETTDVTEEETERLAEETEEELDTEVAQAAGEQGLQAEEQETETEESGTPETGDTNNRSDPQTGQENAGRVVELQGLHVPDDSSSVSGEQSSLARADFGETRERQDFVTITEAKKRQERKEGVDMSKALLQAQKDFLAELKPHVAREKVTMKDIRELHLRVSHLFHGEVPMAFLVKLLGGDPEALGMRLTKPTLKKMALLEKDGFPFELKEYCRELNAQSPKSEVLATGTEFSEKWEVSIQGPQANITPLPGSALIVVPPAAHSLFSKGIKDGGDQDQFLLVKPESKETVLITAIRINRDAPAIIQMVKDIGLAALKRNTLDPADKALVILKEA